MSAAWAGVILAAFSIVFTVAYTEFRLRRKRESRLALGVAPHELRSQVVELRKLFSQIVADGGEENPWFLQEDRKYVGDHLRDQANRVGDDELKEHTLSAAQSWNQAFALAPPEPGLGPHDVYVGYGEPAPERKYTQEDNQHNRRKGRVLDAANEGLGHCQAALKRLTELERAAPEV